MTIDEAVKIMRGPVGSPIDLEIGRPGESEPFEVTVVRDAIKVASVRSRFLAPGYGYLRIAQFGRPTGDEAAAALDKLMAESELEGLVIDLRNNPGGVLVPALRYPTCLSTAAWWFTRRAAIPCPGTL